MELQTLMNMFFPCFSGVITAAQQQMSESSNPLDNVPKARYWWLLSLLLVGVARMISRGKFVTATETMGETLNPISKNDSHKKGGCAFGRTLMQLNPEAKC